MAEVVPTLSPSMDIQISSNFERLLFEYYQRDGASVTRIMEQFRRNRRVSFGKARWRNMGKLFEGRRLGDSETQDSLAALYHKTGELTDPHTIIGIKAGQAARANASSAALVTSPVVSLATAHPAKFPDAVEGATGQRPRLPVRLADLFDREERMVSLPNDIDQVELYITGRLEGSEAT